MHPTWTGNRRETEHKSFSHPPIDLLRLSGSIWPSRRDVCVAKQQTRSSCGARPALKCTRRPGPGFLQRPPAVTLPCWHCCALLCYNRPWLDYAAWVIMSPGSPSSESPNMWVVLGHPKYHTSYFSCGKV